MTRIHVFCEGQTEETFVRELLVPHFQPLDLHLNSIVVSTGPKGKGGVVSYAKLRKQLLDKCKGDPKAWVTTFVDLYGLPRDFPSVPAQGEPISRARALRQAFQDDIGEHNFLANLSVHEFEGLLFSSPAAFKESFGKTEARAIADIRQSFATPEHINAGRDTAPSKRILAICEGYDKVHHGSLVALDTGLGTIRDECSLFDEWLTNLESLTG